MKCKNLMLTCCLVFMLSCCAVDNPGGSADFYIENKTGALIRVEVYGNYSRALHGDGLFISPGEKVKFYYDVLFDKNPMPGDCLEKMVVYDAARDVILLEREPVVNNEWHEAGVEDDSRFYHAQFTFIYTGGM